MPKPRKRPIDTLIELLELDADALELYDKALEHIDHPDIKAMIASIEADHERHIADLTQLVLDLGGEPPPAKVDFKGTMLKAMTALRSASGTKGALKALRTDEKLTGKTYEKAAEIEMPKPAAEVIARNLLDERSHLDAIEAILDELRGRARTVTTDEEDHDDGDDRFGVLGSEPPSIRR